MHKKVMVKFADNFLTGNLAKRRLMFISSSLEEMQMNLLALLPQKIVTCLTVPSVLKQLLCRITLLWKI